MADRDVPVLPLRPLPPAVPGKVGRAVLLLLLLPLLLPCGCSDFTLLPGETPTASAGPDRKASLGSRVVLDGTGSRDPQGDLLSFEWSATDPLGRRVELDNAASPTPAFTASTAGQYTVTLVVSDNQSHRSPKDQAVVTALSNRSLLPDTGQDNCYGASAPIPFPAPGDPFDGQDGQYATNPMRLLDNGATVHDNVTGLDWQKGDTGSTYNWYEATGTANGAYNPGGATDVCGALSDNSLGGFTDWRLPSRHELASVTELSGVSPALDGARFPGAAAAPYWSSTRSSRDLQQYGWAVGFADGSVSERLRSERHRVRCVRGTGRTAAYTANGNGTVTDNATGLVWEQASASGRSWIQALAWCEGRTLGGSGEWRLPNAKELESLVLVTGDATGASPTIDPALGSAPGSYWSSTSRVAGGAADNAWTVDFNTGTVTPEGGEKGSTTPYVRCVR